jgi:choloylglycine hydrolase
MGGMNEAGLIIDNMWLEVTEYPEPDARTQLGGLQWIQYQLDLSGSIQEVVQRASAVRIDPSTASPLHFLVCARDGGCAVIEFLGGQMTVYVGEDLPVTALTNNTYAESCRFLEQCGGDEESPAFSAAGMSLRRFKWAADGVAGFVPGEPEEAIDYAFSVLEKVSVARTRWSIVYDSRCGRVHFQTRANPARRYVDLTKCDFSCQSPVRVLDMAAGEEGEVTGRLEIYSLEANHDLIDRTFTGTPFLSGVSEITREWLARYPETLECVR